MVQPMVRWQLGLAVLLLTAACSCSGPIARPAGPAPEGTAPQKDDTAQIIVRAQSGSETNSAQTPEGTAQGSSEGYHFPDDRSGALLERLLTPGRQPWPTDRTGQPRPRPASRLLDNPSPELPPVATLVPRLPSRTRSSPVQPRLTLEETLDDLAEPTRLGLAPLPEGPRIRQPAADLSQPVPLPILARQLSERASLDDPTTEVSLAEAVMGIVPPRTTLAPFQKQTLPDPFEFRQPVGRPALIPSDEDVPATTQSPRP
jgi:hypothetical protein